MGRYDKASGLFSCAVWTLRETNPRGKRILTEAHECGALYRPGKNCAQGHGEFARGLGTDATTAGSIGELSRHTAIAIMQ